MIPYEDIIRNKDVVTPIFDIGLPVNRCVGFDIGYTRVSIEDSGVLLISKIDKARVPIKIIKEANPVFTFKKTHFCIKTMAYILAIDYVTGQILQLSVETDEPTR